METISVQLDRVLDDTDSARLAGTQSLEVSWARVQFAPAGQKRILTTDLTTWDLAGGVGVFKTEPTPPGNALHVVVRGISEEFERWVIVSEGDGGKDLSELATVNPDTLDPEAEPEAAWAAGLDAEIAARQALDVRVTDLEESGGASVTDEAVAALVDEPATSAAIDARIGTSISEKADASALADEVSARENAVAALQSAVDQLPTDSDVAAAAQAVLDSIVAGAPAALDTLNEIAARIADDNDVVAALTATVAGKVDQSTYDTFAANVGAGFDAQGSLNNDILQDITDEANARATADAALGNAVELKAPLRAVQQHIAPRIVREVDPSPATVTVGAAADAGTYNRQYIYASAGATWPIDSGHAITTNVSGYEYNGNPGGVRRARFMCDRDRVQFYMAPAGAGSTFEVYIDGKRQSASPFVFATASGQYVTIVVPGGVHRPRLFEVVTDAGISLIATSKPGKIWKPGPSTGPKVLVVGDSFCQPTVSANTGTGYATTRTEGIYQNIAPLLGLPDVLCQGLGGTGWLRTNGGSQNYRTRIPALLDTFEPDVLVGFGGGLNDFANGFTVDQVRDQVIAAMSEFRAGRPDLKLVFVEGLAPPGVTPATINPQYVSVSSQARAALTEVGVYWIDVATTSPWINGAGNVNAVNADGENANVYVGGDGIHLTAAGHIYVRERVAIALRRILADDGTLLNTLI